MVGVSSNTISGFHTTSGIHRHETRDRKLSTIRISTAWLEHIQQGFPETCSSFRADHLAFLASTDSFIFLSFHFWFRNCKWVPYRFDSSVQFAAKRDTESDRGHAGPDILCSVHKTLSAESQHMNFNYFIMPMLHDMNTCYTVTHVFITIVIFFVLINLHCFAYVASLHLRLWRWWVNLHHNTCRSLIH